MKKEDVKFIGFRLQDGTFFGRDEFGKLANGMRLAVNHVTYLLCDRYTLNTNGGVVIMEDTDGNSSTFVCENIHTHTIDPSIVFIGELGKYNIPLRILEVKDSETLLVDLKRLNDPIIVPS